MKENFPPVEEMTDILDIEGIRYFPWMEIFKGLGFILGLLLLVALLYCLWRLIRYLVDVWKRSKQTPLERGLKALHALAARDWPEKGQMRLFYFELSSLLRRYLEEEFHYPATDKTTPEIRRELSSHTILTESQIKMIEEIFKRADWAKFAEGSPLASEARDDVAASMGILHESDAAHRLHLAESKAGGK